MEWRESSDHSNNDEDSVKSKTGPWFLLVIASAFPALKGYSEVVRCNLPANKQKTLGG